MDIQELCVVASLDKQVTGIAITDKERIFLSMPTFINKDNYNVGELIDGDVKPYKVGDLKCVTSVNTEGNILYIVDEDKLVVVDTTSDKVIRVHKPKLASGSKLNDIRIVNETALLSEYGNGSIVVLDLTTGRFRQVLLNSTKSKAQKTSAVIYGNKISGEINLDGIELSPDKKTFYFCFPMGGNLWSIQTKDLLDPTLTARNLDIRVKKENELPVVGGILMLPNGSLMLSNAEKCSIDILKNGKISTYIKPSRLLQWPDALFLYKDYIYFACSQLDLSPLLHPDGENKMREPYNIFRIPKPE